MSTRPLPIHSVTRGLVLLNGLSVQEAAIRAGVSPGSVAALCERTPQQITTWLRLLGGVGATLAIECQGRAWAVTVPRPAAPLQTREWVQWRHRRQVSALNHLDSAEPGMKRSAREAKVAGYVGNEEARLRDRLVQLRAELRQLAGIHRVGGLREAVQAIAGKAALKAEELALLAGVSLGAAQLVLGDDHDGRLATLHRLLSALSARITVRLGTAAIAIGLCPPGDWRPLRGEEPASAPAPARTRRAPADAAPNRSRIASATILALYDRGLSIGDIARQAGVSRQRVHKLAMDHGRQPRRLLAREQRIEDGRGLLAIE